MEEPNFKEMFMMYEQIAKSIFGNSDDPQYSITSDTLRNGRILYHLNFQGARIKHAYEIAEIFMYLYIKGIDRSQVVLFP